MLLVFHSSISSNTVSMSVSIGVVSGREGTLRVTCRATGGTLSTSALTGPGLGGGGLQLQAEGSIGRTGQNNYSVTSDTLSGHSNGDTYTCTAMNNVSSPEISTVLAGILYIVNSPEISRILGRYIIIKKIIYIYYIHNYSNNYNEQ